MIRIKKIKEKFFDADDVILITDSDQNRSKGIYQQGIWKSQNNKSNNTEEYYLNKLIALCKQKGISFTDAKPSDFTKPELNIIDKAGYKWYINHSTNETYLMRK